jgi:hypothetical protein
MFTKTNIAIAAAIMFGSVSAALANDIDQSPSTAQSEREWREYMGQRPGHLGNAGSAYGYFGSTEQDDSRLSKKGHNR